MGEGGREGKKREVGERRKKERGEEGKQRFKYWCMCKPVHVHIHVHVYRACKHTLYCLYMHTSVQVHVHYTVHICTYMYMCKLSVLHCIPSRSVFCLTGVLAAPEGLEEEGGLASLEGTDDLDWPMIRAPIVGGTIVGGPVGRPIVGGAIVGGEMVVALLLTTKLGSNGEKLIVEVVFRHYTCTMCCTCTMCTCTVRTYMYMYTVHVHCTSNVHVHWCTYTCTCTVRTYNVHVHVQCT